MSGLALWFYPVGPAVLAVLLCVYFGVYLRALRPRTGTLEWIYRYDPSSVALGGSRFPMTAADVLPLLAAVAASALFHGVIAYALVTQSIVSSPDLWVYFSYAGLPALSCGAVYVLLKGLFGRRSLALIGCLFLTVGSAHTATPATTMATSFGALFLYCFVSADPKESYLGRLPWLLLTALTWAVGCYFDPCTVLFAPVVLVMLGLWAWERFVQDGVCMAAFFGSLAGFLAMTAVAVGMLFVPAAMAQSMVFPQLLFDGAYYGLIWARLQDLFAGRFGTVAWQSVIYAWIYGGPMLLCGLFGAAACTEGVLRRRDLRGLWILVLLVGTVIQWLLGGCFAVPVAATLALCYGLDTLFARGRRVLVQVGVSMGLWFLLIFYILAWYLA